MALTTAQLIGSPAFADMKDLDRAQEIGKKATGAGSAIPIGRVAFHTPASGLWAIATAASPGRFGVIPRLAPWQTDGSADMHLVTGKDAEIYVESSGAIKPGAFVVADTGGKVKARAAEAANLIVGVYVGHYGEGSGLGTPATDAANAEAVRIKLVGGIG